LQYQALAGARAILVSDDVIALSIQLTAVSHSLSQRGVTAHQLLRLAEPLPRD